MEGMSAQIADRGPVGGSAASGVAGVRESLRGIDVGSLSDRERLALVAELERLKGAASACQARAVEAVRESREHAAPRDARRSVGSEVALARRESPTLGDRFVGLARRPGRGAARDDAVPDRRGGGGAARPRDRPRDGDVDAGGPRGGGPAAGSAAGVAVPAGGGSGGAAGGGRAGRGVGGGPVGGGGAVAAGVGAAGAGRDGVPDGARAVAGRGRGVRGGAGRGRRRWSAGSAPTRAPTGVGWGRWRPTRRCGCWRGWRRGRCSRWRCSW